MQRDIEIHLLVPDFATSHCVINIRNMHKTVYWMLKSNLYNKNIFAVFLGSAFV